MVSPASSTVATITREVRHLTNSPGENSLTTAYIEETLNDIYNTDFPYAIKTDQMRDVYEFYTLPNIDKYPLDVNYNQGVRSPAYFDGVQGGFYKDRRQFFNMWPKLPFRSQPFTGDGVTKAFSFNVPGPFLRGEVVIGVALNGGGYATIVDNSDGVLYLMVPNAQTSSPAFSTKPAVPGMYNKNLGNPGLYNPTTSTPAPVSNIGTVNYVSGDFTLDFDKFPDVPAAAAQGDVQVSQYNTGEPYSLMFWNNEFTVRPVPEKIHKIEIEVYLTPVQFISTADHPIVNQWWKYLAYLVSAEIQRRRGDFDSVNMLQEGLKRQEGLVLERQGVEEIGTPTYTLFNSTANSPYGAYFSQGWF